MNEQDPTAPPATPTSNPTPNAAPVSGAGLKTWASAHASDPIGTRLKMLTPSQAPGTVQHPFPVESRESYLEAIKGAGVFKRAETAPQVRLPLKGLRAIQGSINMERVMQHAQDPTYVKPGARAPGHGGLVDLPIVVKKNGQLYIHDGHHRLTAAALRGQVDARVRLVDLDTGK